MRGKCKKKENPHQSDAGRRLSGGCSSPTIMAQTLPFHQNRERENISRAESEGISKMDPTGQSFKARPKYIEQVGRATDVCTEGGA